MKIFCRQIELA